MKQFIVILDNIDQENTNKIIEQIKSYRVWARISDTVWCIRTDSNTTTLRDAIYPKGNLSCKVLVVDISSSHWASYNLSNEVVDWLKKDL